jgi:hypothetical protein
MSYLPRVLGELCAQIRRRRCGCQAAGAVVVVVDVDATVVVVDAGVVVVVDVEAAVVVVVSLTPVWGMGPWSSSPQAPSVSTATTADPRTAQRLPRRFPTALEHGGRVAQVTKPRPSVDSP